MKSPINSQKHIVQQTLDTVAMGSNTAYTLLVSTETPTSAHHVPVGAVVKAIFVEWWSLSEAAQPGTSTQSVEKLKGGQSVMTFAQSQALHTYPNKANILEIHQGIIPDANSNPIPAFRGWVKIPKGKQRMALGDQLVLNVNSQTDVVEVCGICIYKSYT